jgi:putative membrane protein
VVRLILTGVVYLVANAIGLVAAAALLDDVSLDAGGLVTAVLIFTAVEVVAQPLITQIALKQARALIGGTALVATLIGLVITVWLADGLRIDGALGWVLATVIVWAAALLAGLVLPFLLLKRAAGDAAAAR